jgi:hypothetical protein
MSRDEQIEQMLQLVARLRGTPRPRYMELPWIERAAWLHVLEADK